MVPMGAGTVSGPVSAWSSVAHRCRAQSRMPRVCIGKNPGWFALARRKGGSIPRFPDGPVGKEDGEVRSDG